MPATMDFTEYARHRKDKGFSGGTRAAVQKAVDSNRITTISGKIDPETADIEWERNTRKRVDIHGGLEQAEKPLEYIPMEATKQNLQPPKQDWGDSKARKEAAEAEMKEMELAERKGELIDRRGYEMAAHKTARILRDSLINNLPARTAQELASITDPWELECALRDALRAELKDICKALTTNDEEPAHA